MLPFMNWLIDILEKHIFEPEPDVSRPRYLKVAVDAFPETLESALRKEVIHLYENAAELILHGLNLHRQRIFSTDNIAETVRNSRSTLDLKIEEDYERRINTLYSAIFEFTSLIGEKSLPPDVAARVYDLRDVAGDNVQAAKSVKHLRKKHPAIYRAPAGCRDPALRWFAHRDRQNSLRNPQAGTCRTRRSQLSLAGSGARADRG